HVPVLRAVLLPRRHHGRVVLVGASHAPVDDGRRALADGPRDLPGRLPGAPGRRTPHRVACALGRASRLGARRRLRGALLRRPVLLGADGTAVRVHAVLTLGAPHRGVVASVTRSRRYAPRSRSPRSTPSASSPSIAPTRAARSCGPTST